MWNNKKHTPCCQVTILHVKKNLHKFKWNEVPFNIALVKFEVLLTY